MLTAADSAQGLTTLNDMIDEWQQENLPVYALTPISITLANGVGAYTVGLGGGTVNVARPAGVQMGPAAASVTISAVTTPVQVVDDVTWKELYAGLSASPGGTGTPNTLWFDPQYPLGVFNIMPVPTGAGTLVVQGWTAASSLPNLATNTVFASGASRALKTNLAVRLQPYFLDTQLSQVLALEAQQSKNALRFTNITSRAMMRRHQLPKEPQGRPA